MRADSFWNGWNDSSGLTFLLRLRPVCAAAAVVALSLGLSNACALGLLDNPDWTESEAPAPPAFNPEKLLPLDMPPYVTLQVGVDPATLSVTPDGIVRYVVVARSNSGTITAFYEGILCAKGEVKRYARIQSNGQWRLFAQPQWRALDDNQPSPHARVFARQGACEGNTAANSVADIVHSLQSR